MHRRRTHAATLTALVAVLSLAAALAAATRAPAQVPADPASAVPSDPGQTCTATTGQSLGCDTKYTPVTKDGAEIGWQQVAGAINPGAPTKPTAATGYDANATPVTVDFYTVSFLNPRNGLAAGARCKDDPPAGVEGQALADFLAGCTRVPVVYGYSLHDGLAQWREVYRGDSPGFVGAIAWLGMDPQTHEPRALAVGGDGCYPRREDRSLCAAGNLPPAVAPDPIAGKGRAWLMAGTRWQELDTPASMTGLAALDVSNRAGDCLGAVSECALAGGLRQIWMWKDGEFDPTPWTTDPGAESRPVDQGGDLCCGVNTGKMNWQFRVRAIRFHESLESNLVAAAVTAGCCDDSVPGGQSNRLNGGERLLGFFRNDETLHVTSLFLEVPGQPNTQTLGDSAFALTFYGDRGGGDSLSALITPGGPERSTEPHPRVVSILPAFPSAAVGNAFKPSDIPFDATSPSLSSAKLVAGGGDAQSAGRNVYQGTTGGAPWQGPDGIMDWAVGSLRGSGEAVAFSTVADTSYSSLPAPHHPLDCPDTSDPTQRYPNCRPDQSAPEQTRSGQLFSLSSWSLNGFTMLDSGVGWGVGDRGAIEHLGGDATTAALPPESAPKLGAKRVGSAPDGSPYRGLGPELSDTPGDVPSLSSRPPRRLSSPQMSAYGSPNPDSLEYGGEGVGRMVMSRDGSEGWAVGPAATLYHFDGAGWSRCETHAVEGAIAADPACAPLDPLAQYGSGVRFTAIARIPMENGSDPTKADDFEAIAAGQYPVIPGPSDVIVEYRDGQWSVDEEATKQLDLSPSVTITDIAFSSPDDGWLVAGTPGQNLVLNIFHFNGRQWTACNSGTVISPNENVSGCDDTGPNPVLPLGNFSLPAGGVHVTSAGQRIYMYGGRMPTHNSAGQDPGPDYPFILYKDPGQPWKQAYDPGCASFDPTGACVPSSDSSTQGALFTLSVAQGSDGSFNGWGVGDFGPGAQGAVPVKPARGANETPLINSTDGVAWRPVLSNGAADEYLLPENATKSTLPARTAQVVAIPGPGGRGPVFISSNAAAGTDAQVPMLWRDPSGGQWRVLAAPFAQVKGAQDFRQQASVQALAADNGGGLWLAATPTFGAGSWFYRYSSTAPPDLFQDAPHPIRERITSAAGGADGSFWVATDSSVLYRYDRRTGWDRMTVPGWDPGRVVTRPSEASAIAVGPDGDGLVVGERGRIADIGPGGGVLDSASGTLCAGASAAPCGTGRHLRAAAIAPDDGSAMVGGDYRSLLYRQGEAGSFGAIDPPPTAAYATITGISLPASDEAWVVTNTGEIWAGHGAGQSWSWDREDTNPFGDALGRNANGRQQPLNAISVDAGGHGYAVGDQGTILQRSGSGDQPWERIEAGQLNDLTSVTQGPGGHGVLIGGAYGLILTLENGRFEPARQADYFAPTDFGSQIVGLALLPGYDSGQLEAWAASQAQDATRTPAPGAVLHYTSDPDQPLLDGQAGRAQALSDMPGGKPDDLNFTAFGQSGCQLGNEGEACPELTGSNEANDVIARRIRDQVVAGSGTSEGPAFALFTGDVGDLAGTKRTNTANTPLDPSLVHERWADLIGDPLLAGGVPVFGALGGRDLSNVQACYPFGQFVCASTHSSRTGPNLAWRRTFAGMPAPWGAPGSPEAHSGESLSFVPVGTSGEKVEPGDQTIGDPTAIVGDQTIPTGGAHTHYAFDVERDGQKLLRVAVLDTSLGSLGGSDGQQNPTEEQLRWLEEALQRPAGERAVVVSNTPTYSFGPGALSDTETDGTALESVLMAANVDLVVSGRLGWNAVYWAMAPGLHCPRPSSPQPDPSEPPTDPGCAATTGSDADQAVSDAQRQAGDAIGGGTGTRPLPFVIASSAGGRFGPDGNGSGSAGDGYWRGYTDITIDPSSDAPPAIAQRPVFDWIGIQSKRPGDATHVMRAGKKFSLVGYGREPAGIDVPFRYDEISTPSITHRFDLLAADPDNPWLPMRASDDGVRDGAATRVGEPDPCGPYLCLDPKIGTIDDQTGEVRAGSGTYPRTFAIAALSVNGRSATYPLVFEPRASYRPPRPVTVPPVAVPPPPAAAPPANPQTPTASLPPAPVLPVLAAQAPPPPPAPPAPPTFASQAPTDLSIAPTTLDVSPPTAVSQPPTPPVNPAPPSGARREARQRQAAAQKSGADSDGESSEVQEQGGDLAQSPLSGDGAAQATARHTPSGNPATARRRQRPSVSIDPLSADGQPSAWTRDLLLGGGLGIAALVLSLGLRNARPTPRRRQPEVPAPAFVRRRR